MTKTSQAKVSHFRPPCLLWDSDYSRLDGDEYSSTYVDVGDGSSDKKNIF